ncbi:MAG: class I SAM-dependent methyltransferase [Bacteroidia bacterium]|nr:class I SAM-dependent methyltransferase [Bacteroidia bacterium]
MNYWLKRLPYLVKKGILFKEFKAHFSHKKKIVYKKKLPIVSIDTIMPNTSFEKRDDIFEDGNVSLYELECICRLIKKHQPKNIFEIGTFNGRTTYHLAANAPEQAKIFTLDLPQNQVAATDLRIKTGEKKFINKDFSGAYFLDTPMQQKITQIYADSAQHNYSKYNNTIDFIFVDGSHSYEYVKNDTEVARKLLHNGKGVILWHDYGWNEVIQALNEYKDSDLFFKNLINIQDTSLAYLVIE